MAQKVSKSFKYTASYSANNQNEKDISVSVCSGKYDSILYLPTGIAVLSEALEMSSLQELDLSFNSLGNEGLSAAKTSLSSMANLAKLNLSHNEFTENSAVHLYEILVESQRLKELDLSWNCLNSPSCKFKEIQMLLDNSSITTSIGL